MRGLLQYYRSSSCSKRCCFSAFPTSQRPFAILLIDSEPYHANESRYMPASRHSRACQPFQPLPYPPETSTSSSSATSRVLRPPPRRGYNCVSARRGSFFCLAAITTLPFKTTTLSTSHDCYAQRFLVSKCTKGAAALPSARTIPKVP